MRDKTRPYQYVRCIEKSVTRGWIRSIVIEGADLGHRPPAPRAMEQEEPVSSSIFVVSFVEYTIQNSDEDRPNKSCEKITVTNIKHAT